MTWTITPFKIMAKLCSARFCRRIVIPVVVLALLCYLFVTILYSDRQHQFQYAGRFHIDIANKVHTNNSVGSQQPFHKPQLQYTYISSSNSSTHSGLGHGGFDTYTTPRLMSCQGPSSKSLVLAELVNRADLTVAKCQKFCVKQGTVYAALFNGINCYCMNVHGTNYLEKDSECNVTCSGDKGSKCGGADRWLFYKVAEADGVRGWTTWMSFGSQVNEKSRLMSRYRGCVGDKHKQRECLVRLEKKTAPNTSAEAVSIEKHFIGCFTHQTWRMTNLSYIMSNQSQKESNRTALKCVEYCQSRQSIYAVVVSSRCICSDSLGWSRPVDTCIYGFGALIFTSKPMQTPLLSLKFEARLTKKNIAVVAHYRGGSSFASTMFSEYPGALYIFEPASVYHVAWLGVNMSLAKEAERSKMFLQRIYPLWFDCAASDLPGILLSRYPGWGQLNKGLEVFDQCKKGVRSPNAPHMCSPYLEEKCLIAPIVTAKTTRMIHADNLREFSRQATNIELIHVFRDPRGTLYSRAKMEKWYRESQSIHLRIACWELNQLGALFDSNNRSSNLHSVPYEDLATDAVGTARKMYEELGLTIDDNVVEKLKIATGQGDAVRKNEFDVIQQNPKSHINRWTESLDKTIVNKGDNSKPCKRLFRSYPLYYKPLKDMKAES